MLAHHITFGTRGFWPSNDPAGGGSEYVWATHLRRFGPVVKVRRRVHRTGNELRRAIKDAYLYAEVVFTGLQARSVAGGFTTATEEADYRCYAAVVMPNHVHLVISTLTVPIFKTFIALASVRMCRNASRNAVSFLRRKVQCVS